MNRYEATIGGYSFIMQDDDRIEVWENVNDEYPVSYIFVKEGSIDSEKKFHIEISDWTFKNIS